MTLSTYNPFGDEKVLRSIDWLENFPWRQDNALRTSKDKYEINLNMKDFSPEEITVKVANGFVVIEAYHEERKDEHGYVSRKIVRRYPLPDECVQEKVESRLSSDGVLTITAPRKPLVKTNTVIPVKYESSAAKCKL